MNSQAGEENSKLRKKITLSKKLVFFLDLKRKEGQARSNNLRKGILRYFLDDNC